MSDRVRSGSSKLALVQVHGEVRRSDAELVQALLGGDAQAIGLIWDRHATLVRQVLRSSLGPDADVEDLLQEVFIVLFRSAAKLRDPNALRPFLIGVAVRKLAFERRRRWVRRWVTLTPTGVVPDAEQSPRDVEGLDALRVLYRLLEGLPERRRMAFVLRHVQGLAVLDVAAALKVSESTAKREIRRAREAILARARREPALQDYLDVNGGDDD
ncbi:MAG: RNA polymerase sigma factor [Polyangiales bacterium]